MKNVLTVLFLVLSIGNSFSQSFIDNYFQNLVDDDESTVITVSGDMFRYAAALVDDSDEDAASTKDVLEGIISLQFVAIEESVDPEVEYQKGLRTIPDDVTEMVSVKSKEGRLKVFVNEENETVYEIIALGTDDHSFFVGSVLCNIKLENVSELLNHIQSQNGGHFKQLMNVEFDELNELNVYPNPASTSSRLSIEIPKSMRGGVGELIDPSGRTIRTFKLSDANQLELKNLQPGSYIINVAKDEIQLQKKVLIVN